jgi:hypothetical protein
MDDLTVPSLLTDEQRDAEFDRLSVDDCGHIAAFVASQYPDVFDAALAAFARYRGGLEVAA